MINQTLVHGFGPRWLRELHKFFIYRIYKFISIAIANFKSRVAYFRNISLFDKVDKKLVKQLSRDGYIILENFFSSDEIKVLYDQIKPKLDAEENIQKGGSCNFSNQGSMTLTDPFACIKGLADLVLSEKIISLLAAHKHFIPTLKYKIMRSHPQNEITGSSILHRDLAGEVGVFIYLHDIDAQRGPTFYLPKSNHYSLRSNKVDPAKGLEADQSHWTSNDFIPMHGKAGTVIIMDLTGYHKGPVWSDAENQYRDIILLSTGQKHVGVIKRAFPLVKIRMPSMLYQQLSKLQKIFVDTTGVEIIDEVSQ
jgi:hypothetical protein